MTFDTSYLNENSCYSRTEQERNNMRTGIVVNRHRRPNLLCHFILYKHLYTLKKHLYFVQRLAYDTVFCQLTHMQEMLIILHIRCVLLICSQYDLRACKECCAHKRLNCWTHMSTTFQMRNDGVMRHITQSHTAARPYYFLYSMLVHNNSFILYSYLMHSSMRVVARSFITTYYPQTNRSVDQSVLLLYQSLRTLPQAENTTN